MVFASSDEVITHKEGRSSAVEMFEAPFVNHLKGLSEHRLENMSSGLMPLATAETRCRT